MVVFYIVFALCVCFAGGGVVLTIDDENFSVQNFYSRYPKKQWERADSTQKDKMYTDFIQRELCIIEAKNIGFLKDPVIAVKVRDRSEQILVNESYEQFVAHPLIDSAEIAMARKYAKTELFLSHILVGHSAAYLAKPPGRTVEEALALAEDVGNMFSSGESFSVLAEKYSDDPGVFNNHGSLGWVEWGMTVPEFQSAAFAQDLGILSRPILTSFGYHLILVTDRRNSDYQFMSDDEYESAIVNIAKGSVRNKLRAAAIAYDSLQIIKYGVNFNLDAIATISQSYVYKQKQGLLSASTSMSSSDFLESLADRVVVCLYRGNAYGARWFANKIKKIPPSRQPDLGSGEQILSVFKTILLQDIAIKKAYMAGVDNSFTFIKRTGEMVSGLLYDAYLKYLVSLAPRPDSSMVKKYYNVHKHEKYSSPERVSIREIRIRSRVLADSLYSLLTLGDDFVFLAEKYSLSNSRDGGLLVPFSREKNNSFFDAVIGLDLGNVTPVLSAPGNKFSILRLEKILPKEPKDYNSVYARIEALLIKEAQDKTKEIEINILQNKYNIKKEPVVLF